MKKLVIVSAALCLCSLYATEQQTEFPHLHNGNQQQVQQWITESTANNRAENLRTALQLNTLSLTEQDKDGNTLLHTFAQKADPEMLEVVASFCSADLFNKENKSKENAFVIINSQVKELFTSETAFSDDDLNFDPAKLKLFNQLIACKQILRKYHNPLPTFAPSATQDDLRFALKYTIIPYAEKLDEQENTVLHHFAMNPNKKVLDCLKQIPAKAFLQKNKQGETPLVVAQKRMAQLLQSVEGKKDYESYQEGFSFIEEKTKEAKNPTEQPVEQQKATCCIIV
ncbi:MAG: hypothetical protein AB7R69_00620 [Candidatus Babeliales bacterium]